MKNHKILLPLVLVFTFLSLFASLVPHEVSAKPQQAKYKKCRLKCLEKDSKCTRKASGKKKKNKEIKKNIDCLSEKNLCLEKCSDQI